MRREDVSNAIWSDPEFSTLTAPAKLVYLWSFTNPRCGMAGLYKVPEHAIAHETGLTKRQVTAALEELVSASFIRYEQHTLWVRSRVKHMRTHTKQIARSVAKDVHAFSEDHPLRVALEEMYSASEYDWLRPSDEPQENFIGTSTQPQARLQGKGSGKGKGLRSTRAGACESGHDPERAHWHRWAAAHLPEERPEIVAGVCLGFVAAGREPTVDALRARFKQMEAA